MAQVKLNVSKLIEDLGGARAAANICGVARTVPYGWIKRGYLGSPVIERIKAAHPNLDLDYYFQEARDEQEQAGRRP